MNKTSKNLTVSKESCSRLVEMSKRLTIKQSVIFEYLIDDFYFNKYHDNKITHEIGDKSILDLFQM